MVGRPGRHQSAFTAGEVSELINERDELKYFSTGLSRAENIKIIPQGGFTVREGLRDIGALHANAARIFPFTASDGSVYDLVLRNGEAQVWGATSALSTFAISGLNSAMLAEVTFAQQLDTMLLFHADLRPKRIRHAGPADWTVDNVPFQNIPTYDYGENYTNGVTAKWEMEYFGLITNPRSVYTINVAGEETLAVEYFASTGPLASRVRQAIEALPGVSPGIIAEGIGDEAPYKVEVEFAGAGNEGDGWAISATVINKADAAIITRQTRVGVMPGEPLISSARGWPQCGAFYNQRLLMGGFKSLPQAWMFSRQGDYFNFDDRSVDATGSALIPMDLPGGERIEHIVGSRNLLIFTSEGEYWLAERGLSATSAPNHVLSSTHGVRRGCAVAQSEGAALFVHPSGGVVGEFRYTDVEGNYVAVDISLLAPHLVDGVGDIALRRARKSDDGHALALVQDDGKARLATMLREQEITAFARIESPGGSFKAVAVNGRNEMSFVVQRPAGRRLERFEPGLLLDEAVDFALSPASANLTGLSRFNGRDVWVLADGHVLGPFTVSGGTIALPFTVSSATVGTWSPPKVTTLPLPRTIGPNIVLKRRARVHSVVLSVVDTTSIAIQANDGRIYDIDLVRFGAPADVPELERGYSGEIRLRGLTGHVSDPRVTITQVRPGRMTVRSITVEANL